jgi:hypothetical protein
VAFFFKKSQINAHTLPKNRTTENKKKKREVIWDLLMTYFGKKKSLGIEVYIDFHYAFQNVMPITIQSHGNYH